MSRLLRFVHLWGKQLSADRLQGTGCRVADSQWRVGAGTSSALEVENLGTPAITVSRIGIC
jgi:hypothetical protein